LEIASIGLSRLPIAEAVMDLSNETLLGRVAVAAKLISIEQLNEAVLEHGRSGDKLGDVLVKLGFLDEAGLLRLVELQKQVVAKAKAKAQTKTQDAIEPAPGPPEPSEPKVTEGAMPMPTISPISSAAEAPQEAEPEPVFEPTSTATSARPPAPAEPQPTSGGRPGSLDELLRDAVESGASDIHVHSGAPLKFRMRQQLYVHGSQALTQKEAEALVLPCLVPEERALFEERGELDFCYELRGVGRFRANVYRQLRGTDASLRFIPPQPPSLDDLGLPSTLAKFTSYHQGMVLLTGPTSCGKSSTMAALVNLINEERAEHILTIEDPIEYLHKSNRCLVNQRSVQRHTESFARALRAALREDPDVIVIGELRDRETISLAMSAAETGHFVLATLHTDNAVRTINRMIGAFPPDQQDQVRTMLSESLKAVISQRLVPTLDESGLAPALEIMVVNRAVGNLIREQKTVQIRSMLQTGSSHGMCLLDNSLAEMVAAGIISREQAHRICEDPKLIP